MRIRMTAGLVLLALAPAVVGCGGASQEPAPPPPPPPPPETVHRVPDLPDRWRVHVNRAGGFAFGLPPGWRARDRGIRTVVRSFDRLAAVSIVPDRTEAATELELADFATRAFAALGGFEEELVGRGPRRFEHRYDAVQIRSAATAARSGVRQRVRLIVLRRGELVTFTAVIAANANRGRVSERLAARLTRTLRSRPVGRGER